jgi:hypothetical protein
VSLTLPGRVSRGMQCPRLGRQHTDRRYSDDSRGFIWLLLLVFGFAAGSAAFSLWRDQPRKKIGIHYVNLSLPMDWQGCYKCRVNNSGVGAMFSYRMTNHFWFDSEVNQFPGSGSSKGSGSATEGLFGIRYGYTCRVWNVYVKARPGFIYYPKTTSFPTGHEFASLSRFALDCGGIIEMKASKRSSFRFDAGTTFVRYLQGLDPRQAPVAYISPTYIATQGNFQGRNRIRFSLLDN